MMIGSLAGTLLSGRYELEDLLGQGGMAQVYRGTDRVLGRTVAVKVLAPSYARDQNFVQRFRREAQAAARLNHPGVVSVYDTGSDDDVHYIVMEYVAGRTLHDILAQEGRMLPERAAEVAAQVAVAYKHVREDPVLPTELVPEVGEDLEAVVMKAMAKNPANRYATAEEM